MYNLSFDSIDQLLLDNGFYNFEKQLENLFNNFRDIVSGTQLKINGLTTDKYFDCFDSKLNQVSSNKCNLDNGFVIDFGGTNTRIVNFDLNEGKFVCRSLEKFSNNQLINKNLDNQNLLPIERCFDEVVNKILRISKNDPEKIKSVAIIWSNAATSDYISNGILGVTNKVSGIGNGKDYLKNEWFIEGLNNNDDLGQIFLARCVARKINLQKLVMGNDTVFVGLASTGASAAGVISTGANMASVFDVKPNQHTYHRWFNLECGTNFAVNTESVSNIKSDQKDLSIQSLIAGGWFVSRYLNVLEELLDIIDLDDRIVTNQDVINAKWYNDLFVFSQKLFNQNYDFTQLIKSGDLIELLRKLFDTENISPSASYLALKLCHIFSYRIIAFSAVMIAGSIANYSEKLEQLVLLDSRVLEGLDPDLKLLSSNLSKLNRSKIKIQLIKEDINGIGAGILGAANSLAI
jgi:hexokinase